MKTLFDCVYAPLTIGTLLRELTIGHAKHSASHGHTKITGEQILRKGLGPARPNPARARPP